MRAAVRSLAIPILTLALRAGPVIAVPGSPPPGYLFTNISSGIGSTSLSQIGQMVFKPGDPTHLYATRSFQHVVTRYDYNAVTGQLSNPFNVITLTGIADGMDVAQGIGFHGNDLWLTRWKSDGSANTISRFRDGNADSVYETHNEFLSGVATGQHEINQIQIVGNSLYTGIGKRTNTGNPASEQIYNGTVDRIGDLNAATMTDLSTMADQTAFAQSNISDGKFRRYAGGMRNPYGIRVTSTGLVWVADNGQDPATGVDPSPDLLYRNLQPGDFGNFPVTGNPGAPASPVPAFANLGLRVGAAGFDFIPRGPDRGKALVALASATSGQKLALVSSSGTSVANFITGFSLSTDVVPDPFGRLLVSDFSANAIYLLSPPSDGDANLDRRVDVADLLALASHWQTSSNWAGGDFDGNGFVDIADAKIMAQNWTTASSPALAPLLNELGLPNVAVPEPAMALWMASGMLVFMAQHRRR